MAWRTTYYYGNDGLLRRILVVELLSILRWRIHDNNQTT